MMQAISSTHTAVPTQWSATIPLIVRYVEQCGVNSAPILQRVGFDLAALPPRVSLASFRDMAESFDHQMIDPFWGVSVGMSVEPDLYEALAYALSTAPNLDAALQIVADRLELLTDAETITIEIEHAACYVRMASRVSLGRCEELSAQFFCGLCWKALRSVGVAARRFHLRQSSPSQTAALSLMQRLDNEVVFNSPQGDAIELSHVSLVQPLPLSSQSLHRYIVSKLDELCGGLKTEPQFSAEVRRILEQGLGSATLTARRVARSLGMSERTLHRHLQVEGLMWRDLLEDARRQRGIAMLESGARVSDIVNKLGYSEPRALARAFQRWTGMTPSQWRRRHRFGQVESTDLHPTHVEPSEGQSESET